MRSVIAESVMGFEGEEERISWRSLSKSEEEGMAKSVWSGWRDWLETKGLSVHNRRLNQFDQFDQGKIIFFSKSSILTKQKEYVTC